MGIKTEDLTLGSLQYCGKCVKTVITNNGGNEDGGSEENTQHKDLWFIHNILAVVITHMHIFPYFRIRFWMVEIESIFSPSVTKI